MNLDDIISSLNNHSKTDFSRLYNAEYGKESDFKQKKDGWCGPAALSYAMHMMGVDVPQEQLVRDTGTTVKNGIDNKPLIDEVRRFGFDPIVYQGKNPDETLKKMDQAVLDGNAVIVDYLMGNDIQTDGHYAVYLGSTGNHIIIWNPWTGKEQALQRDYFISHWKDGTVKGKPFDYWTLIISRT